MIEVLEKSFNFNCNKITLQEETCVVSGQRFCRLRVTENVYSHWWKFSYLL